MSKIESNVSENISSLNKKVFFFFENGFKKKIYPAHSHMTWSLATVQISFDN